MLTSPEKRCAKSRTLDIISGTCHQPLVSVNATVAATYRSLGGEHPPTLIIDEADTLFGTKRAAEQNEDYRALLNAGHQRGRPALRCVGPNQIPTEFPTFAMAALAGIGVMPDTITDRAVNITMRRRANGEKVSQFRSRREGPPLEALRDRMAAWSATNIAALSQARPDMPVEDRAADTWEPLIAVADAAGGHWPKTARAACRALVEAANEADEEQSLNVKLLVDIRDIFTEMSGVSFLSSETLVMKLREIKESPWGDFELTPRKLANRLKDFGIKPGRNETGNVRGYRLEDMTDAFARYIRQEPSDVSETLHELDKRSDTSKPSDTSKCQSGSMRQNENAVQAPNLTDLTLSDASPAKNGASQSNNGHRERGCQCNRPAPLYLNTGMCWNCFNAASKRQEEPCDDHDRAMTTTALTDIRCPGCTRMHNVFPCFPGCGDDHDDCQVRRPSVDKR